MANIDITSPGASDASLSAAITALQVGGWKTVATTTERDAIAAGRRSVGMVVLVTATNTPYQLVGGVANSNWAPLAIDGSPKATAKRLLARANPQPLAPTLMASPPTVSVGTANANSLVETSRAYNAPRILPTDSRIQVVSGKITLSGGNYAPSWIDGGSAGAQMGFCYRFATDAPQFDIATRDLATSGFAFRVNGEWVSFTPTVPPTTSGSNIYYVKVDFGSSAFRNIDVYCLASTQIRGFNIGSGTSTNNLYKMYPFTAPAPVKVLMFGDSYTYGVGATYPRGSIVYRIGDILGVDAIVGSGYGGSGYLNPGPSPFRTFGTRINDTTVFGAQDLVIVSGGINDKTLGEADPAALQAAVTSFWTSLKALHPNALLVCVGPLVAPSLSTGATTANAIKAGFNAVYDASRMLYISPYDEAWSNGTGDSGQKVTAAAIVSGGSGYAVGNTLTLVPATAPGQTTYTVACTLTVSSVSGGVITGVTIANAGRYDNLIYPTNPVAVTGGAGTGATFSLTWASDATGDGNADLYIGHDRVHPNQAGHNYLSLRIGQSILQWLLTLATA